MVQSQMPPTYQFAAQPAGLTQAGLAQAGLAQTGLAQAGLTQTGLTESGLQTTGLQDYTQVVVSSAMPVSVSSEATSPFKSEQSSFTTAAVTPNGGVEQQTVRARSINVRSLTFLACTECCGSLR